MSPVSYQTIKLSKGKHASPEDGACVMELASMLAGEPFTDHPASVCPVIGSFLRSYNDSIDEHRRQSLYEYASKVVGSRAGQRIQEARAERLAEWADEVLRTRRTWFLRSPLRALTRLRKPPIDAVGPTRCTPSPSTPTRPTPPCSRWWTSCWRLGVRDDRVSARVLAARARALDTAA